MSRLSELRARAFRAQGGRCHYCRMPMWISDPAAFAASHGLTPRQARALQCTAEHLLARRDGGRDTAANIVAACLHCNRLRHARPVALDPGPYARLVGDRMARSSWHSIPTGPFRGQSAPVTPAGSPPPR